MSKPSVIIDLVLHFFDYITYFIEIFNTTKLHFFSILWYNSALDFIIGSFVKAIIMKKQSRSKKLEKTTRRLDRFSIPFLVVGFFIFFSLLVASIITAKEPTEQIEEVREPMTVKAVKFGSLQAEEKAVGTVKNRSSITLVAQSNGSVEKIMVKQGQHVARGTVLLQQSSTYSGSNAPFLQREIAQKNYELANSSYDSTIRQTELARQQAEVQRDNAIQLRGISRDSIKETENIINLSENIIKKIEDDIQAERSANNDPSVIQALNQQLLTFSSSLNQTRSSLRSLELQSTDNGPQKELVDIQYKITLNSLELQESSVKLQKEIAKLNLDLAKVAEESTRIVSPISGRIEVVYPKIGEFLSAGSPTFIIKGEYDLAIEVLLAGRVASLIDKDQPIMIAMPSVGSGGQDLLLAIDHISSAPTNGSLFQLNSTIPKVYSPLLYEGQTLAVSLPVRMSGQEKLLPLDAVFVTNTQSFVFTEFNETARSTPVVTGEIVGQNIEILEGLEPGQTVILDRRAVDGQRIKIEFNSR